MPDDRPGTERNASSRLLLFAVLVAAATVLLCAYGIYATDFGSGQSRLDDVFTF